MMPMLALACQICPKNLEGTVYSFFMSAINFGGIMSGLIGSFITTSLGISSKDYHNLHILILISNFASLVPLPILYCIDNSYLEGEAADEEELKALTHKEDDNQIAISKDTKGSSCSNNNEVKKLNDSMHVGSISHYNNQSNQNDYNTFPYHSQNEERIQRILADGNFDKFKSK